MQWISRVNRMCQVICGFAPSFKSAVSQKAQVNPLFIQTPVENWQLEVNNVAAAPEAMETTIVTVRGTIGPTEVPDGYRSAWEDDRLNIYIVVCRPPKGYAMRTNAGRRMCQAKSLIRMKRQSRMRNMVNWYTRSLISSSRRCF